MHTGDLITPSTVNLFRRALDKDPLLDVSDWLPTPNFKGGMDGEWELLVNTHLRIGDTQRNRDDVGNDLNHIVLLLMAKLRFATPISDNATKEYASQRPHSFGSYLGAYYDHYGDDMTDVTNRVIAGIEARWLSDTSAPYGAVRWYHRPSEGANPQLALLYKEIIAKFIK